MSRRLSALLMVALCVLVAPAPRAQPHGTSTPSLDAPLERVCELQQQLKALHPAFERP